MKSPDRAEIDHLQDVFWTLAAPYLEREGTVRSTMMGSPCLRVHGNFCAAVHRGTGQLLVKLPAERVDELVAAGEGEAFAPAGRVFREWLAVTPDAATDAGKRAWRMRLDEAWRCAAHDAPSV